MAHKDQGVADGWIAFSDWVDEHRGDSDVFLKYDIDESFQKALTSCKSNRERIALVWNNAELRQEVHRFYESDKARLEEKRRGCYTAVKSSELSAEMRRRGNQAYGRENKTEALKLYTLAVKFAPYPILDDKGNNTGDNSLALALANRSAALYVLRRYRLCLIDIDMAFKFNYPAANKYKLLTRKVKCLHILSVWANDVEQIKSDLKKTMAKKDTPEQVKNEIMSMFEFLEKAQPEDFAKSESDIEDETLVKISNSSRTLPQAADCVEMSYDLDKGRYLLTNKDVSVGRLLIAEDPYVCNLNPKSRKEHCYHCFAHLFSCGIGCDTCTRVLYCSLECMEADKQVHSYECGHFLDLQDLLGAVYLVTHIMFKIDFNLEEIPVHTRKTTEMKTLEEVLNIPHSNWPDQVYKNDYASVLALMDHAEDQDYDELMSYTLTAVYFVIAFGDYFSGNKLGDRLESEESKLVIGSVILRHILQLQTNLISILDQDLQNLVMEGGSIKNASEKPIGVGVYPTISLLNHSCQPNILSIFHRNKFVARALSSLECGTEINYCYGPHMASMSKKDRQKRLKEQYFFTCCCDCCENEKENLARALVCPDCRGPIIYNRDFSHKCLECKRENFFDAYGHLERCKQSLDELEEIDYDDDYEYDDFDDGGVQSLSLLNRVKNVETKLQDIVYWRNRVFVLIKEKLLRFADESGVTDIISRYVKEQYDWSIRMFGENSIETIKIEIQHLSRKRYALETKVEKAKDEAAKKAAIDEMKAHCNEVIALRGRLKDLLNLTNIPGAESTFEPELKRLARTLADLNKFIFGAQLNEDGTVPDGLLSR